MSVSIYTQSSYPITAQSPMPSDNAGNTLATANVLQTSTGFYQKSLIDRVDGLDPVDYYKFQVAGRSSLSVAVSQLSGDVTLNLLNGDGTLLQSSTNSASASELLTRTLDAGIYYLQVNPARPSEGSDYALDFNTQNNPKADITWRNTSGLNAVWNMDGATIGNSFYLTTVNDPNWQMSGVGDFNGDGQNDYLWRYLPTGQNVIWQMNNGAIATVRSLFTVDSSWRINLAADLNNDGTSDILWQRNSGENVVWYLNNGQFSSADSLFTVADQNWKLSAAGDFNQDGRTDLVWRHRLSGNNVIWHMNGSTFINSKSITTVPGQDWTIEGGGDFNSDGRSDLVWRNSNGTNVVWHMVAGEIVGTSPLIYVDPSWQITGVTTRFDDPSPIDRAGSTYSTAFNIGNLSALNSEIGQGTVNFSDRVSSQDKDDYYSFTTNSYQAFTFNLTNLSADANLQIIRSDVSGLSIVATANNLGTASEAITQTLKPGTYYVRVFQNSGDTNYSLTLNAAPARLQVTGPTASNITPIGGILNITWTDNISENIKLELYKGNTFVSTIANSVPSTGSYSWAVSTTLSYGTDYQILASSVINPEFRSFSGQNFTIGSPVYKYEFTYFYNGANTTSDYYTGWVYTAKDLYTVGSLVDVNTSNNQSGLNGRYSITSGTAAANITTTQLGQVFVNGYYDRDSASLMQYTPWKYSQSQAAGTAYLGSEEDTIGSPTKPFGDVKNFTDFGRDNFKFDAWEAPIDAMYQVNATLLGTQVGTYNSATTSPFGTKGIVINYTSGGAIHWSLKTGARVMTKAFIDVYAPTGGSGGFLGFATGDQVAWGRGTRQDFEGGYIYHDGQTVRSFKPTETPVVKYNFTYFYSGPSSNSADYWKSDYYTGWTVANEGKYSVNQFVDVNSGLNEAGKNGQYYITQATLIGSSGELVFQDQGKVWVNQYFNQETSETITPLNQAQSIGANFLGSEYGFLEVTNNIHFDFGLDAFEFDRFIRVDSPNTAQSINAGSSQTITWTDTINENVKIDLYKGSSFISTIANNVLSNGSFTWQLPTTLSGSDFRIRVASMTNAAISDDSDVGFTIVAPLFNPDIDIQIFDPYGSFVNTWRWQAMQVAVENWEKIITRDKDQSGLSKIVVTNDTTYEGGRPWNGDTVAWAYEDSTVKNRTNITQNADVGGIDYDNRIGWRSDRINGFSTNQIIGIMMHEIGHALGLPHEDNNSNSLMYPSNTPNIISDFMLSTLESQGYTVDRSVLGQLNWVG